MSSIAVNWQKFFLLVIALVGLFMLVLVEHIAWQDVAAPFGLIVGYATGNGMSARKGEREDLFTKKEQ